MLGLNQSIFKEKRSIRLITLGEIDILFGEDEFKIPFDFVDDTGDMICWVNIGRIGTDGDIASFCFDCLFTPYVGLFIDVN